MGIWSVLSVLNGNLVSFEGESGEIGKIPLKLVENCLFGITFRQTLEKV
jgi:hypothetical protein